MVESDAGQKRPRVRTKTRKVKVDDKRAIHVVIDAGVYVQLSAYASLKRMTKGQVVEAALAPYLKGYDVYCPSDSVGEDAAAA